MSTIKNLIATVLFSGVAVASFAQAPAAAKDAVTATPAAVTAPAATAKPKHVAKKVEAPAVKDAGAVAPADAASKPAHTGKAALKPIPVKKADTAASAAK